MHYIIRKIRNLKKMLSLHSNLMICPKCEGTGSNPEYDEINSIIYEIQTNWKRPRKYIFIVNCEKCLGDGYIDWVENSTGKKKQDNKRFYRTNIRDISVLFLYSCLFADSKFSLKFLRYDPYENHYYLKPEFLQFSKTLKYFSMYTPLVEKFLFDHDKTCFEYGIKDGIIRNGLACANCFSLNSDEFQVRHSNEYYLIRPNIGDKIVANKFIAPMSISYFWLCNKCKNKLTPNKINAFKKRFYYKDRSFGFIRKYHDLFNENIKIKVFY